MLGILVLLLHHFGFSLSALRTHRLKGLKCTGNDGGEEMVESDELVILVSAFVLPLVFIILPSKYLPDHPSLETERLLGFFFFLPSICNHLPSSWLFFFLIPLYPQTFTKSLCHGPVRNN